MKENEKLPIMEYLAARKEAYYMVALLALFTLASAVMAFVLLYSGSPQRSFESIMTGSLFFMAAFVVRPYWAKKRAYETDYPKLKGLTTKGIKVPGVFLMKCLVVLVGELTILMMAFSTYYRPTVYQERQYIPNINDPSSSKERELSTDGVYVNEDGTTTVRVPTVGDIKVDFRDKIGSSETSEGSESEVIADE